MVKLLQNRGKFSEIFCEYYMVYCGSTFCVGTFLLIFAMSQICMRQCLILVILNLDPICQFLTTVCASSHTLSSHTHFNIKPSRSMWLFYGRQVLMADFAMIIPSILPCPKLIAALPKLQSLKKAARACFRLELMIFVNIQRSSNTASSYLRRENAWAIIHPSKCLFTPPDFK